MKYDLDETVNGFRRQAFVQPGFECPDDCLPECRGQPREGRWGRHGRGGDKWVYVVGNGDVAVSLVVWTDLYRGAHTRLGQTKPRIGAADDGVPYELRDVVGGTVTGAIHSAFPFELAIRVVFPDFNCAGSRWIGPASEHD